MADLHLQPGPVDGLDAYIKGGAYANINFGSTGTLQLGRANNLWVFTLMKFIVLQSEGGVIPAGSFINSAILKLWQWKHYGINNIISSYLMIRDWSETLCTWNNATSPPGAWEIPGAMGATDREQISEDPTTLCNLATKDTWVEFTLTKIFQKIVDNDTNAGFIFIGINSPSTELRSSDYITDTTKRPILDINYYPFSPFQIKSNFLRCKFP